MSTFEQLITDQEIPTMHSLTVVIPTYNEIANIETLLTGISEVAAHHAAVDLVVVIVDDSSPDGTADLVTKVAPALERSNLRIEVLIKEDKAGLGAAYVWAFDQLLARDVVTEYYLQMDADLSHDPKYISGFIHQMHLGTDLVVASRYVPGGGTPDWSWRRRALSHGGNSYARALLGRRVTDYTGGYNMFSARLLSQIRVGTIKSTGYGFVIAMKYRATLHANSITQIPIVFLDRTRGSSKMPSNTLLKNFILVFQMRFLRRHL